MIQVKALAAQEAGGKLSPIEYTIDAPGASEVIIKVESCGLCHSDLSMINNDWGNAEYPLVPGHEVVGTVLHKGDEVSHLDVGQRVGLGWYATSCMHCGQCMGGDHNLCGEAQGTIVGRHGGFASHVKASAEWVIPIPDAIKAVEAGPLFCGGITVFNPIVELGIKPTDRVGVIGIGGLGHMALQFLAAWGCEVTAFTSSEGKTEEAKKLGAHHVVNSRDAKALKPLRGQFDAIINTTNVDLKWDAYVTALAPKGRLHTVGAVLGAFGVSNGFMLVGGQKSVSGSPLGSPATTATMVDFCARHDIAPMIEKMPMSKANDALERLDAGEARYRIVLEMDL